MQPDADDRWEQHRQGLAEHGGLGLDPADAPGEHTEPVDHRGVRVGAQAHVGIGPTLVGHDNAGQVLDVDLVHDPGTRRDDGEVPQRPLPPLEEAVSLGVAAVLDLDVAGERVRRAEYVGDHRVVDHQLRGDDGVDLGGVAAERHSGVAHRGQVHQRGHPVGVMQEHPGRVQVDGTGERFRRAPVEQCLDLVRGDLLAVFVAEQVLQHDPQAVGQVGRSELGDPVDVVGHAIHLEPVRGAEGVEAPREPFAHLMQLRLRACGVACRAACQL